MTEEMTGNQEPVKKEEVAKEAPKEIAPKDTPAKEAPKKEAAEPKNVVPQKIKPEVVQKSDNCMKCNKRLQRKTCYYRNNGYYCSKRCWRQAVQAAAEKQAKEKEKAKKQA